ncbi:MAG: hypothetical protein NTW97_05385 [Candidatus Krumholzibacteria bacterium]|nr:hypothetical protein [Candidatus Krumholzibacteria bacterium]
MNYKVHGVTFLILATGAWLLGMAVVMSSSLPWGIIDLALIVMSFAAVIYFYCAKCTARKVCSHVLPGYLTRYFPARRIEPYSRTDVVIMAAAFLSMTAFPLYWLARSISMLLVYAGLLAIAVVELRAKVCGDCRNIHCVLKKNPRCGTLP